MAELKGMQGNEIADDFKRIEKPDGRWRQTWDVFKSNFWKMVFLNLIVFVTFIPGIAVIAARNAYLESLGNVYPFNATVGYPFYTHEALTGLAERLYLWVDIRFYALLIAAGLVAAVGISGASYCIRKLLQTEGQFNFKGFLHGIKVGYLKTVIPATVFLLFIYMTLIVGDWTHLVSANGGNAAGAITAYVFAIIATVLAGIYLAFAFSIGVSYRVKFKYLLRNSFTLIISTPIQTVFMIGFSLIPVWLVMMFGGFWLILAYIIFVFFGFSFILLSWLSYTQWACDLFIAPAVKSEKGGAKASKSEKELAIERAEEERRQALALLAAGKSELIARPIMPIGGEEPIKRLGKTFTRAQVAGIAAGREKLGSDVLAYEKQHENDKEFVEYNKMFAEREKALVSDDGKGKKNKNKKISAENLLK